MNPDQNAPLSGFVVFASMVQVQVKKNQTDQGSPSETKIVHGGPSFKSVIFLPARPASQTHDSHKGRMIFNHVSPAGRIKNCGEKSALSF